MLRGGWIISGRRVEVAQKVVLISLEELVFFFSNHYRSDHHSRVGDMIFLIVVSTN